MSLHKAWQATRRYGESGHDEDLRRALAVWEEVLHDMPLEAGERAWRAYQAYASLNLEAYWRWGQPAHLERALALHQALLRYDLPPDLRLQVVNNQALALQDRFQREGRQEDLEQALRLWEEGLPLVQDRETRARVLNNLATGYWMLGNVRLEEAFLERAQALWQEVIDALPATHPDALWARSNLAAALRERALATGREDVLRRSQQILEDALAHLAPGAERALVRNNLALTLWERFQRHGELEALEAALAQWKQALEELPAGSPQQVSVGHHVVVALANRARLLGRLTDLDEGWAYWERLRKRVVGPEDRALLAKAEAALHEAQYVLLGDLQALDRTRAILQKAMQEPGLPEGLQLSLMSQQARLAWEYYQRSGARSALQQARDLWEQLLRQVPPNHPDAPVWLNNWVLTLLESPEPPSVLEAARAQLEDVLDQTPPDTPTWAQWANHVAWILQTLARHSAASSQAPTLLWRSLKTYLRARRASRQVPWLCLRLHNNLASALWDAGSWFDRPAWRTLALRVWATVAQAAQSTHPETALAALWNLAKWSFAQQNWSQAVTAFEQGWLVVQNLYARQPLPGYGLAWLREIQDWPAMHAYALVRLGRLVEAVQALERGRTWLLREALWQKGGWQARLRNGGNEEQVWKPGIQAEGDRSRAPTSSQTPSWTGSTLQALCRRVGPVVFLLATVHGGLALILRSDRAHPVALELPELTSAQAQRHLERLHHGWVLLRQGQSQKAREALTATLSWLARGLAPLFQSPDAWSRNGVTLIPTGVLSRFPFHAVPTPKGTPWAFHVRMRYAISAFLLGYFENTVQAAQTRAHVLVGNPGGDLPFTQTEVQAIAALLPEPVEVYLRQQATREAVQQALRRARWFHFAGHVRLGAQGVQLALADGPLAWSELSHIQAPGHVAVLSGCETGLTDLRIPEETLGLPAAFHLMGFPVVVASLWPMPDWSTTLFMYRFYQNLQADATHPETALQMTQRWMAQVTWQELDAYLAELRRKGQGIELVLALRPRVKLALAQGQGAERVFPHPLDWAGFAVWGYLPTRWRET